MDVGEVRAQLTVDMAQMQRTMERAERELKQYERTTDRQLDKAENRWRNYGRTVARYSNRMKSSISGVVSRLGSLQASIAGAGAAFAGYALVKHMADFERSLSLVKVTSRATAEQMHKLRGAAKEMGATTEFSASRAAEAEKYLSMAGLSVKQTFGALPKMLDLATAGQLDLARAADVSTNVMTMFGMKIRELTDVNDALVAVQSTANTNIEEAATALTYAGAKAKAFQMDVEDTVALIGMLANSGIKASKAGTTLRQAMQKLLAPTGDAKEILEKYDVQVTNSEGEMRNFVEVLKDMADANISAKEAAELLGARASNLLPVLRKGSSGIESYNQKIRNMSGIAESAAQTIRDDMQGAIDKLSSRMESVAIAVWEEYKDTIKDTTEDAAKYLGDHRKEIVDFTNKLVTSGKNIGSELVPALEGVKGAMQGIWTVYSRLPEDVVGAGGTGLVVAFLTGSKRIGAVAAAISLLNDAMDDLDNSLSDIKDSYMGSNEAFQNIWDVLSGKRDWQTGGMQVGGKVTDNTRSATGVVESGTGKTVDYEAIQDNAQQAAMKEFEQSISDVESTTKKMNETLFKGKEGMLALAEATDTQNKKTEEELTDLEKIIQSYENKKKAILMTDEAYAKYIAIQELGDDATKEEIKRLKEVIGEYHNLKYAKENALTPPTGVGPSMGSRAGADDEQVKEQIEKQREKQRRIEEGTTKWTDVKNLEKLQQMQIGAKAGFQELKEESLNFAEISENAVTGAFDGMSDALTDFVMTGEMQWEKLARSAIRQITKIMIKMQMMQALKGTGAGGGSGGWLGTALKMGVSAAASYFGGSGGGAVQAGTGDVATTSRGAAFDNGQIMPYANGGIVDNPTVFPMANGAGVMGEAGPEAVMPLTRTDSGDLGVKTEEKESPNVTVNVINKTGEKADAKQEKPKWDGQQWVMNIVLDAVNRNQSGFGKNLKAGLQKV